MAARIPSALHQRHGLDPNDTERACWFDLEALTLTLMDN
jgi:hypothetical protein